MKKMTTVRVVEKALRLYVSMTEEMVREYEEKGAIGDLESKEVKEEIKALEVAKTLVRRCEEEYLQVSFVSEETKDRWNSVAKNRRTV